MAKQRKIKQWQIDAVIEAIEDGRTVIENITDDRLRSKVASAMKAAKSDPHTITLTGSIKRESENAVYFVPSVADANEHHLDAAWWPKSQIEIFERSMGPCDQIDAPEWLLQKKLA